MNSTSTGVKEPAVTLKYCKDCGKLSAVRHGTMHPHECVVAKKEKAHAAR